MARLSRYQVDGTLETRFGFVSRGEHIWSEPYLARSVLSEWFEGHEIVGLPQWLDLLARLAEFWSQLASDSRGLVPRRRDYSWVLDPFFDLTSGLRAPIECCVFVSHRRGDKALAERIAWMSCQHGFDYWLDVHDPWLNALSAAPIPSPVKEILTAAIIEIALLNSTHVVAIHSATSAGSKWIPYEFGRAKAHGITTSQACSWFDPTASSIDAGEYTFLAARTHSEHELDAWLAREAGGPRGCSLPKKGWSGEEPAPLPAFSLRRI